MSAGSGSICGSVMAAGPGMGGVATGVSETMAGVSVGVAGVCCAGVGVAAGAVAVVCCAGREVTLPASPRTEGTFSKIEQLDEQAIKAEHIIMARGCRWGCMLVFIGA